jgi:hypothetical protein
MECLLKQKLIFRKLLLRLPLSLAMHRDTNRVLLMKKTTLNFKKQSVIAGYYRFHFLGINIGTGSTNALREHLMGFGTGGLIFYRLKLENPIFWFETRSKLDKTDIQLKNYEERFNRHKLSLDLAANAKLKLTMYVKIKIKKKTHN